MIHNHVPTIAVVLTVSLCVLLMTFGAVTAQNFDDTDNVSITAPSAVETGSTFTVNVSVENSAVTVVEFEAPFSLNLSETDREQDLVVAIMDDQEKENVSFGGASYTGTYTVTVDMEVGTEGDVIDVRSWIGSPYRDEADEETTASVDVGITGSLEPSNPFADQGGEPLGISDAADVLFEWNQDGSVNGSTYTVGDMSDYLFEWNQVRG